MLYKEFTYNYMSAKRMSTEILGLCEKLAHAVYLHFCGTSLVINKILYVLHVCIHRYPDSYKTSQQNVAIVTKKMNSFKLKTKPWKLR